MADRPMYSRMKSLSEGDDIHRLLGECLMTFVLFEPIFQCFLQCIA